jgi:hypothetical protein
MRTTAIDQTGPNSSETATGIAAMKRSAPNAGFHLMDRSPSTREQDK